MQLTIERAALLKALGHVQSVVERRNTIPILSNVLLSAGRRPADASRPPTWTWRSSTRPRPRWTAEGQITAPAHTLYEIVRKLPEGAEVSLQLHRRRPAPGRSRPAARTFNLPVLPAGDFPVMSADGAAGPVQPAHGTTWSG